MLDGRVAPDRIAGKLVLIGTSAIGLNDIKTTPVSPAMPGVEIHAQVLESALTGAVVSQPNYGIAIEFFARAHPRDCWSSPSRRISVRSRWSSSAALFASVLVGTSWFFYTQHRLLIDFTYPLMSTTAIYLTLIFSSFVREQAQRRQIRSAFGQYLSPALVEQLAQSPEKLVLGGEEREMTIMFSDVRGFTSISETYKHDPQGLTALMNRFLTPLTNAILARKGTIDKYMGDAIMAFWNAPLDDKEHQINACEAAVDMLERIDELNKAREQEAQDGGHVYIPLNVGVGLNTGICVVGNMGSDVRFDYSVSATASISPRASKARSKEYGFPIIVGSKTALAVKDKFAILELDFIMVKGKKEPEVIYAIAGREDVAQSGRFQRLRNLTIEMLACYRSRDWEGALAAIERGRKTDDGHALDLLYNLYEARIRELHRRPAAGRLERRVRAADEVATAGAIELRCRPGESARTHNARRVALSRGSRPTLASRQHPPRRMGPGFRRDDDVATRVPRTHSSPICVRSWNQCCACTNFFTFGDSACGLVSCTTQTSTASSTISACACASSSSCLAASKVCLASSISASTFGFL